MSTLATTTGQVLFKLSYQISPIILTGGVAELVPGGLLPIMALTEAANFVDGLLNGTVAETDLDKYFAHFVPLSGSTLLENDVGLYPMANQSVAANAIINMPTNISLKMICPAQQSGSYVAKLATMTALVATLKTHSNLGGLYTVATPSYIYTNAILRRITDISDGSTLQPQFQYRFDFFCPLVSHSQAQAAQNSLMNKLTNGLPTNGALSGSDAVVGNAFSGAGSSLIPSLSGLTGSSASPSSVFNQILGNLP